MGFDDAPAESLVEQSNHVCKRHVNSVRVALACVYGQRFARGRLVCGLASWSLRVVALLHHPAVLRERERLDLCSSKTTAGCMGHALLSEHCLP